MAYRDAVPRPAVAALVAELQLGHGCARPELLGLARDFAEVTTGGIPGLLEDMLVLHHSWPAPAAATRFFRKGDVWVASGDGLLSVVDTRGEDPPFTPRTGLFHGVHRYPHTHVDSLAVQTVGDREWDVVRDVVRGAAAAEDGNGAPPAADAYALAAAAARMASAAMVVQEWARAWMWDPAERCEKCGGAVFAGDVEFMTPGPVGAGIVCRAHRCPCCQKSLYAYDFDQIPLDPRDERCEECYGSLCPECGRGCACYP